MTTRWRARWAAGVAVVALSAGACGDDTAPVDAVPALGRQLDAVDAALVDRDYERARTAIEELVASAAQAEVAGDLDEEEADRIRQAASRLLARLPADGEVDPGSPVPLPQPTDEASEPSVVPTEEPDEEEPEDDEPDEDEGDEGKGDEGKGDEGKGKKGKDKGKGND